MEYNDIAEHQTTTEGQFIDDIKELLEAARNNVVRQVNTTMLMTYFEIGRRIVEQEQKGESQADYGQYCLSLKKVDSQQRVNNGVFTHPETVQLL